VAHELGLEPVLRWSITSRTTLQDGLYYYDAIARLQDTPQAGENKEQDRPSATTSSWVHWHRVSGIRTGRTLLSARAVIDEIDKSDIDLPNDLLHIFEEGEFEIPELKRHPTTHMRSLPGTAAPK